MDSSGRVSEGSGSGLQRLTHSYPPSVGELFLSSKLETRPFGGLASDSNTDGPQSSPSNRMVSILFFLDVPCPFTPRYPFCQLYRICQRYTLV